jgi:uncharacterized protein (DUF1684 family)
MTADPAYFAAIEAWAAARDRRLRSIDGWLAVTIRVGVDEGDETPIGRFTLIDGPAVVQGGERIALPLVRDGKRWEAAHVGDEGWVLRCRDPESPAILQFGGIERFPIDERLRVPAQVTAIDGGHRVAFTLGGMQHALRSWFEDGGAPSLPFMDRTSGATTYAAGRFALAKKEAGGWFVDFNLAFNPPCALNELISCPLAPPENRLPIAIEAGEKYPLRSK